LLLLPTTTYRADGFVDAAIDLELDLTVASDVPSAFQDQLPADLLTLDLANSDAAVETVRAFAKQHPISAVVGVDDDTAVLAAVIGQALGLPSNLVSAASTARSKPLQRKMLCERGVPVPSFTVHALAEDPIEVASSTEYPCVLKPVSLSASRGVIRADNQEEFLSAHARLDAIVQSTRGAEQQFLVERYIAGPEFALEGLVVNGDLHVLALFDKPDPLVGPFFEETIYVTPSRLDEAVQESLTDCAGRAVAALGLVRGPVHIELRYNNEGPWLIEMAARPIGGKCGRVLRFGEQGESSLETLILRHAIDTAANIPPRELLAAGVMMIPIPRAGVLLGVEGVGAARSEPGVEEVLITAHRGQELVPLPEGSRYLGFIFARGETPAFAEAALRNAHDRLEVRIGRLGA
jgi:formate-dependent phosphoribosylglycinamide formyltransferase (GAR transformylase)